MYEAEGHRACLSPLRVSIYDVLSIIIMGISAFCNSALLLVLMNKMPR